MNEKSPEAFRTISEVAEWLGVPTHVLRFWESRFAQVKPVKRAGGRRYYRPADMELLGGIRKLLHDQGMTIRGVQKILREKGVRYVCGLSPSLDEPVDLEARSNVVDIDELRAEEEAAAFKEPDAFTETPEPEPELSPEDQAFAADNAALSAGTWDEGGEEAAPEAEPELEMDLGPEPEALEAAPDEVDDALAALEANPPESFEAPADAPDAEPALEAEAALEAEPELEAVIDAVSEAEPEAAPELAEAPDLEVPDLEAAAEALDFPEESRVEDAAAAAAEPDLAELTEDAADAPTPDWDMSAEAEVPLPGAELPEEAIAPLNEALEETLETPLNEPLDELAMAEDASMEFDAPDLPEATDEAGFDTDIAALDEAGFEAAAPDDGLADLADLSSEDEMPDIADEALPDLETVAEVEALPDLGGLAEDLDGAPAPLEGVAPLPEAAELAPDLPELPEVEADDLADLAALDGASEAEISELPEIGGEDVSTESTPELAALAEAELPEAELPEVELPEAGLPETELAELPPLGSDAFDEATPDEGGLALPGSDPLADMADLAELPADLAEPLADLTEPLADLAGPPADLAEPLVDLGGDAMDAGEAPVLDALMLTPEDAVPAASEPMAPELPEIETVVEAEVEAEAGKLADATVDMAPVDSPEMADEAPAAPAPELVMPDIGPDPEDDDDLPLGALTAAHLRVVRARNANVSTATFGALQDRLTELSLRWQDADNPQRGQL